MKPTRWPAVIVIVAAMWASARAWGDTGSLAGRLQLTLDLDRYAWSSGEYVPKALVSFTNVSAESIIFDRPTADSWDERTYNGNQWVIVTASDGQPVPSDGPIIVERRPGTEWIPTVTLAPEESHAYMTSLILWGYYLPGLSLSPGLYTVQAVYEYFDVPRPIFDDADEEKQWIGENHQLLFSNVVPLEVLEQGAKAPERVKLARDGTPAPDALPRMIVRGHLMADARVFKDSGADISKSEGSATINRGEKSVTLPVGRWPKEIQDKHPPAIPCIGGGLLVPVRYVAESLGMKVTWDPKTQTANILTG